MDVESLASHEGETPEEIAELAAACVRHVERAMGFRLDGTAETLPVLDHYLRATEASVRSHQELLDLVALPAGAYFGEVVRRVIPARWFAPPSEFERFRLELLPAFVSFNPLAVALEAALGEEVSGWGGYFRLQPADQRRVKPFLDELPPMEATELLLPSSRLEVLEIIVDHLTNGSEPRVFSSEDYGPFRAETIALGAGSNGPS